MSSTESRAVRLTGFVLIGGIVALAIAALAVPTIGLLTLAGVKLPSVRPIEEIQGIYYMATRSTYQMLDRCVATDPQLVYIPREGSCHFRNAEFATTLHFSSAGRKVPARTGKAGPAIALLGDSFTMGWGVEDDETFANVLQQQVSAPVYNFGVSSYATEREMERLLRWPGNQRVGTVVIQYSDNDLNENREYPIGRARAQQRYARAKQAVDTSFGTATAIVFQRIAAQLNLLAEEEGSAGPGRATAADHRASILRVLSEYDDYLTGKRVVVFYVNGWGASLEGFETIQRLGNVDVEFVDFDLRRERDFYDLDDHLTPEGHRRVATGLARILLGDERA